MASLLCPVCPTTTSASSGDLDLVDHLAGLVAVVEGAVSCGATEQLRNVAPAVRWARDRTHAAIHGAAELDAAMRLRAVGLVGVAWTALAARPLADVPEGCPVCGDVTAVDADRAGGWWREIASRLTATRPVTVTPAVKLGSALLARVHVAMHFPVDLAGDPVALLVFEAFEDAVAEVTG